ncbi:5-(carboxyamino)imidazole ribonucleotide synthase [Halochromatium salexigens]|uniref:N5-carboxyaminoimidazole ribonucleotide synthase n=1 Tax=Halochromatium salexigens TaxID=49447 RepID=A0AAJ0XFU8_HALSE|nr:5-(carboxyamino)imidazole ribonucleotide synthase [Halochromatium salexigens]MBK5930748.1 5-(carboxyamino)imidazole ribonucleotide synthase [Halochromatium salexigens]
MSKQHRSPDQYPYPVFRIGIIGGGQLGRMLVKAARRIGCTCVVLDPTPESPAGQVSGRQILADSHDPDALQQLADQVDVITFDIEDIDVAILSTIAQRGHRILPPTALLAEIQDKLRQKQLLLRLGIPSAEFVAAEQPDVDSFARFGYPLVQKARRGGYDGRGVVVMRSAADFDQALPVPSLIERFIPAAKELAVIVVRGQEGEVRSYDPVEMCFRSGENILDMLLAPARLPAATAAAACRLAIETVTALEGVGIFGVELFLTQDGELLVNEVAPRTHNSGHYTIEACITDQFEQHLRAITGLPLGVTDQLMPAAMINLLGAPGESGPPVIRGLRAALAIPGVSVHLYGKAETRPFRKMGHVTVLDADIERAREKAEQVRSLIEIGGEQD